MTPLLMRRAALAAALAALILPTAAHATPPPADAEQAEAGRTAFTPTDVVLGTRLLFRVRTPSADGLSPEKRAERVSERLLTALTTDRALVDAAAVERRGGHRAPTPESVTVGRDAAGVPEVRVYGRPLVSVDADLARANGAASPEALAALWAGRLRSALADAEARGALTDPMRAVAGLPDPAPARPASRVAEGRGGEP
jgi:hypothetical protein